MGTIFEEATPLRIEDQISSVSFADKEVSLVKDSLSSTSEISPDLGAIILYLSLIFKVQKN